MNLPELDYLVIAPHPDDAELGVGGTMLLLKAQGASVGVLDLTDGEPTPNGCSVLSGLRQVRQLGRRSVLFPAAVPGSGSRSDQPAG